MFQHIFYQVGSQLELLFLCAFHIDNIHWWLFFKFK